jgi:hypothetical protein
LTFSSSPFHPCQIIKLSLSLLLYVLVWLPLLLLLPVLLSLLCSGVPGMLAHPAS